MRCLAIARLAALVPYALAAAALSACSSGSKAAPSSSAAASASAAPSAKPSAAAVPSASAGAHLALDCPETAFHHEDPEFCLTLDRPGAPPIATPDGAWKSIEIGPMATVSYAKMSVDDAVHDLRKVWGEDFLKSRTHYEEKDDGGKTVVRYKSFDPDEDPKAAEAIDVMVVFGKSGAYTIRCEIDGSMTQEEVCGSLKLPP